MADNGMLKIKQIEGLEAILTGTAVAAPPGELIFGTGLATPITSSEMLTYDLVDGLTIGAGGLTVEVGSLTVSELGGSGDKMVVVDNAGVLSIQDIPATAALTSTYIGYGGLDDIMTGHSSFRWDNTNKYIIIKDATDTHTSYFGRNFWYVNQGGYIAQGLMRSLDSAFGNPLGNGAFELGTTSAAGFILGTTSNTPVVIGTWNSETMRIMNGPAVKIGTAVVGSAITYPAQLTIAKDQNDTTRLTISNNGPGIGLTTQILMETGWGGGAYITRYNAVYGGNLSGSNVPIAGAIIMQNSANADGPTAPVVLYGNIVYNIPGLVSTNYGTRADSTGFRIGQLSGLGTANTVLFQAGSNLTWDDTTFTLGTNSNLVVTGTNSSTRVQINNSASISTSLAVASGTGTGIVLTGAATLINMGYTTSLGGLVRDTVILGSATGTGQSSGSGLGILTQIRNSAATLVDITRQSQILVTATAGSETSAFSWQTKSSGGSLAEAMRLEGTLLKINILAGATERLVHADTAGNLHAETDIITTYITDGTVMDLLEDDANWDANGNYIGTLITGTYEGQMHYADYYLFHCVTDNVWVRIGRTFSGVTDPEIAYGSGTAGLQSSPRFTIGTNGITAVGRSHTTDGYQWGYNPAIVIEPANEASTFPALVFNKNADNTKYGSIIWQDADYQSLTASGAGNHAFISAYQYDATRGAFQIGVQGNLGTTAATKIFEAIGTEVNFGSATRVDVNPDGITFDSNFSSYGILRYGRNASNAVMGIQSKLVTGFSGVIFGYSDTVFGSFLLNGPSAAGNYTGTSLPFASSVNMQAGSAYQLNFHISAASLTAQTGTVVTNRSIRLDANGFRIGKNSSVHTANTHPFLVEGTTGGSLYYENAATYNILHNISPDGTKALSMYALNDYALVQGNNLVINSLSTTSGLGLRSSGASGFIWAYPGDTQVNGFRADSVGFRIGAGTATTANTYAGMEIELPIKADDLAGTDDRMVEADDDGILSATTVIRDAWITDATAIGLLEDTDNWDVLGEYTGTAISDTYQGQEHYDSNYFFKCVSDNLWIRMARV